MIRSPFPAVLAGLMLLTSLAHAAEFARFQPDRSSIGFVSKQMNVPVEGRFKRFSSTLAFDPAKPATAKATLDIDLASIDAGSKEANDEVVGKAWFNVREFPTAKFVAGSVRPLGGNRYELAGKMTIKGRTRDLVTPVTVSIDGKTATFDGTLVILRADYGIGEGVWADFSAVANEIQIKFRIVASATK